MASTRSRAIDFAIERQRHAGFVGRAELLAQLDQLVISDRTDRWVVLTGGPGMGKSAVLAAWLARREVAGDVVPHHFIRRGWATWDDPEALVGSLVAQIEARFPETREPEADEQLSPAARLAAVLLRVSERVLVPRGDRLVLLIDGLDEYDPRPGTPPGDPLAAFLPYALPPGVSVLCASRPRHPYLDKLAMRGALVKIDLDDAPSFADDNAATVRAFWGKAAPALGLDAAFIDQAVKRAAGNLQHAVMLRQQLAGLPPEQRQVEDIPLGLNASIASAWERIAIDPLVVNGLGILCAARDALTLDELGWVAGWTSEPQRRTFLGRARELLIETRRTSRMFEYRLHHDSIRAYIAEAIGSDALAAHHLALAQRLATWPAPADAAARRYALNHALLHRAEAGAWADALRVAGDLAFLEAKCRELGAHDAEADVGRTATRCRASGDDAQGDRLADLARALVRESHWLQAAPEATAALVWNRLRRLGWSESELDVQLRVPAAADILRVRHAATRVSPALVRSLEGHTGRVTACAVTPDGDHVVSASDDQTLKIWELASGRQVATLQGHTGEVTTCVVTPDGRHVVSASQDGTLKVWELRSGRQLVTRKSRTHRDRVTACAVTPDGRRVVSASEDGTLKVWELRSGRSRATLKGHPYRVTACAVTPDGRRVVSASEDGTLKVWELESRGHVATLEGHTHWVTACAVTPDGRHVVSASADRTLKVWELASGRHMATFQGHTWHVKTCAVTPDGRHVVSASRDGMLEIWELANGRHLTTLQGHAGAVTACVVTPDGRHVVSASEDRTLKVWELGSRHRVATLEGHANWVTACAVTPDGRHAASASGDRTLKVWELASGRLVGTLQGHTSWVTACAVMPDGQHVISASQDGTLEVWELGSGRQIATLDDHTYWVTACAVMPDGQRVVSASGDRTLKVWDLTSRRAVVTLQGHSDVVTACAVTPDGRHVISASDDRTLKVWDLETYTCRITHRGDTGYLSVAVSANTVIAGDMAGGVWFLDWPLAKDSQHIADDRGKEHRLASTPDRSLSPPRSPMKHTILYVAANPLDTDRLALDEECAAIERELRMTSGRDDFDFRSKWAVSIDELMRHLNELQPTVLHFSGRGSTGGAAFSVRSGDPERDVTGVRSAGILLQEGQSRQYVSDCALAKMIASAAPSTRVVVLNACYSYDVADSLRHEVDCVVGMDDAIADTAARSFAVAFYRALGHRRSIGNAIDQAAATLEAKHTGARPLCATRDGLRADQIFLPTVERSRPDPEAQQGRTGAASQPGTATAPSKVGDPP